MTNHDSMKMEHVLAKLQADPPLSVFSLLVCLWFSHCSGAADSFLAAFPEELES